MNVIPAFLEHNAADLYARFSRIRSPRYHLDVMDNSWLHHRTIGARALKRMRTSAFIEAHLMVNQPLRKMKSFKGVADMVIVHIEKIKDVDDFVKKAHDLGFRAGVAVNPETPLKRLLLHAAGLDRVLIMTVHPGTQGATFDRSALQKVRVLRKRFPTLSIAVDGGIRHGTARLARKAGADTLVVGSAIVHALHPQKAFEALKKEAAFSRKQ